MKYFLLFLIIIAAGSCNIIDQKRIVGNGKIISQTYNLKDFSKVDIGSSMDIFLTHGDKQEVKIETDENLFKYLNVRVSDGNTLDVDKSTHTNLDPTGSIKIYITANEMDNIKISGSAKLQFRGKFVQDKKIKIDLSGASIGNVYLHAPIVELESTGASTLTAEGECRDVLADASGAATINTFKLMAENGDADASGASIIRIFSSISLKASASGASGIKYKGNPTVTSSANGASSIGKAD